MSVQAGGETRCGIGTRLRAGRERKGLTVVHASEKMHVDAKILESLESEDFEALGAPVYVRGHLRHYAELVGEKPDELQALYSNSIRVAQPDLTRIPKAAVVSDPRRLTMPATVLLVAFAVAGGVWWVVTLPKGHPVKPVDQARVAAATPAPSPDVPTAPASPAPVAPTPRQLATPAQAPTPPQATGTAASPRPVALPLEQSTPPPAAHAAAREAQLTLRFSSDSWAEVYDSSGERLFYDIGAANSVRTFKGTPPLRVVLGNAPGVAVEVNGRTADLATLTHADGSAQFVVGRAGRVAPPAP